MNVLNTVSDSSKYAIGITLFACNVTCTVFGTSATIATIIHDPYKVYKEIKLAKQQESELGSTLRLRGMTEIQNVSTILQVKRTKQL